MVESALRAKREQGNAPLPRQASLSAGIGNMTEALRVNLEYQDSNRTVSQPARDQSRAELFAHVLDSHCIIQLA